MERFANTPEGRTFLNSASYRKTDIKIMEAIAFFAKNLTEAHMLWSDYRFGEICHASDLWENLTVNGLHDCDNMIWGRETFGDWRKRHKCGIYSMHHDN